MNKPALVVSVAFLAGCSHRPQARVAAPPRPAAVHTSMSRQIQNAIDAGEGDLAANRLRERLIKEPANTALRMELGSYYAERGQPDLALEHFRLVLEREPGHEKAAIAVARTLRDRNHLPEASATLARFIESNPRCGAAVPAWLGLIQDESGEISKAESAHRLAVSLDEGNAKTRNNLGYNLLTQVKREQAIEEFRAALRLDPKLQIARNNLALALSRGGTAAERDEALLHWQAMSGPAAAHNNVAVVLIEQGDYTGARQQLETALRHQRGFVPAMRNLAILSEMDGRPAVLPAGQQATARDNRGALRRVLARLSGSKPQPAPPADVARSGVKIKKGERTAP